MNLTYAVRRNVPATDARGRPEKIAIAVVTFPDGSSTPVAIPEGLLKTVPPENRDDFIAHEVEAAVGYRVTRQ